MQTGGKNIREMMAREEIYQLCMENCHEGFVHIKEKNILAFNSNADAFLHLHQREEKENIEQILGREYYQQLKKTGLLREELEEKYLCIRMYPIDADGEWLLIINDLSREADMRYELDNIKEINNELQHVFETYNDNTLFVCDSQGKTLWAGSDIAQNCGVTEEYLKEHTVMEMEKERVFYPSVCARVLKSRKAEIVTQITGIGKTGISIGIPVFDNKDDMTYIISLTRDLGYTLKLGQLLSDWKKPAENKLIDTIDMVACSDASMALMHKIQNVARVNANILIRGEPGTGKDRVASKIHKMGRRRLQPFEKVDCRALSDAAQRRLLFGKKDEKGLLEKMADGVIYLDEVGRLSPANGKRLFGYMQEHPVQTCRFLFSTSEDLEEMVSQNRFDRSLWQEISKVTLDILPLRKRREDIPILIKHFTKSANEKYQFEKQFSREAVEALEVYDWPGNVRQLQKTVEEAIVLSDTMLIQIEELPEEIRECRLPESVKGMSGLAEAVAKLEKQMIRDALKEYKTTSLAAKALGVNQSTISRKIQKYGITTGESI